MNQWWNLLSTVFNALAVSFLILMLWYSIIDTGVFMVERICVSTVTQTSATMVSHTSTAATEGKHIFVIYYY